MGLSSAVVVAVVVVAVAVAGNDGVGGSGDVAPSMAILAKVTGAT